MKLVEAEKLAIETLANGNGPLPLPPLLHPSQQQQQNTLTPSQQQQLQQTANQKQHLLAKGNRPASMQFRSSTALVAPQPS